jgi:chemotaxis signal transduction protein
MSDIAPNGFTQVNDSTQFLLFSLSLADGRRIRFGVSSAHIREVAVSRPVTKIPGSGKHVLGALSVRGELIGVLDLEGMLFDEAAPADKPLLVVTDVGDRQQAFMVDAVDRLIDISNEQIKQDARLAARTQGLIAGAALLPGEQIVTLIDLRSTRYANAVDLPPIAGADEMLLDESLPALQAVFGADAILESTTL